MEGMVIVKVASGRSLPLHVDLLCTRSNYFRTALQGGFAEGQKEAIEVPWEGNEQSCVLFLLWLGLMDFPLNCFTSDCALLFLNYCAYFQVTEECWDAVQMKITLPEDFDRLATDIRFVWSRQTIPFSLMRKLIERVTGRLRRLVFLFAWFDEKSAISVSDKRDLEICDSYFLMRELAMTILTLRVAQPHTRHYSYNDSVLANPGDPALSIPTLAEVFAKFPIASNCLQSGWLLELFRKLTSGFE